jgi:hypothetical protein
MSMFNSSIVVRYIEDGRTWLSVVPCSSSSELSSHLEEIFNYSKTPEASNKFFFVVKVGPDGSCCIADLIFCGQYNFITFDPIDIKELLLLDVKCNDSPSQSPESTSEENCSESDPE